MASDRPATVFVVVGPVTAGDVPLLCARARHLLAEVPPGSEVVCDVERLVPPDAHALEALARLQLTARRMGHRVRIAGASDELRSLLRLTGLCAAVGDGPRSAVEGQREPEEREQGGGVEEGVEPHDPPV